MIRFKCACGRELQGRDEDAGRQAKCPACSAVLRIPVRPDEPLEVLPADQPPSRAVQPGRDEGRYAEDDRDRDRPPPRRDERDLVAPGATSGKAITALVLGFLAFPCVIGNLFLASFVALVLGFLALRDIRASGGRLGGQWLAVTGMVLGCIGLMCGGGLGMSYLFIKPRFDETANRQVDTNNLKQLGLAMHNVESTYGYFPAAAAYRGQDGKPLLSWRVALLPHIGQNKLFLRFRFNEPWDSPHNIQFVTQMPRTYLLPGQKNDGTTYYQVFVGPGGLFEDRLKFQPGLPPPGGGPGVLPPPPVRGFRIHEVTDGTSNTILIATASKAVPWTKPEDLPFDRAGPLPPLGGHYHYQNAWMAAFADGSVRPIPATVSPQTLTALITRAGGEVANLPP